MKTKHSRTSLVLFRSDLRLADNPALTQACKQSDFIVPVFTEDFLSQKSWNRPGGASCAWLYRSLKVLDQSLKQCGSRLILRQGEAKKVLMQLIGETGATSVYWNRRYEPDSAKEDAVLEKILADEGMTIKTFPGNLLFEPGTILNKQGEPYKVFTPFWKTLMTQEIPWQPLPRPQNMKPPPRWPKTINVKVLNLRPKGDWDSRLFDDWTPGEASAKKELKRFLKGSIDKYDDQRDLPDIQGTSRLSPHLHFGEISPHTLWALIPHNAMTTPYLRQIIWREFAYHLLHHFPHTTDKPLNDKFTRFPWKKDKAALKTWQKGMTGYPIVDAGMRELWHTGWMHNRVRMIVASFLIKDLMIPWQEGARWFWDTLVDADLANNTMGWQWVAGCGADAAPFFRIFNPITQGEKFDLQGFYVRRWIPEIASIPTQWIHKPWMAPYEAQEKSGVMIGRDYPEPIVDHGQARDLALSAYHQIRGGG